MPTGSTFQITRALRSKIRASKIAASTSTSQPDDNTCNDAREEPVAAPTEKLALVDGGRAKRALEDAESSSVTSLRLITDHIECERRRDAEENRSLKEQLKTETRHREIVQVEYAQLALTCTCKSMREQVRLNSKLLEREQEATTKLRKEKNMVGKRVTVLQKKEKDMERQATRDKAKIETLLEENRLLAEKVAKAKVGWMALKEVGDSLDG